jgi:hypothetical protein
MLSEEFILNKNCLLLLVLILFMSCSQDESITRASVDIDGEVSIAMTISSGTDVHVADDLIFSSTDQVPLVIENDVRFLLGPGVSISFPSGVQFPESGTVSFLSLNSSPWRELEFGPGVHILHNISLRNSANGLVFTGSQYVQITDVSIENVMYAGVSLVAVDTCKISDVSVQNIERVCLFASDECESIEIRRSTFKNCEEGLRIDRSMLDIADSEISGCSIYGLYTHVEHSLVVEHCNFSNNMHHIWNQNTRNQQVRNNMFGIAIDFPIQFERSNGSVFYEQNNISPNEDGWTVNFGVGDTVKMKDNFWGTSVESEISASIYDASDLPNRGVVEFQPFLTSPNGSAGIR